MIIGFDAKRLFCNTTGLGNYSRTLLKNLERFYPEHKYYLYSPKIKNLPETAFFLTNPGYNTYFPRNTLGIFWRSYKIIHRLKRDKIQLFHGLSNEIPRSIYRSGIKSLVTIHDLIFRVYAETYAPLDRTIYNIKAAYSCKHADKIVAISKHTKKDIVKYYHTDPDKIEVIYQSCDPLYYMESEKDEMAGLRKQYHIPDEYILSVGTVEERKNLGMLIEAYKYLPSEMKIPIVAVGRGGKYKKEILSRIQHEKMERYVIWIEDLKETYQLKSLYKHASIFIYPSVYEGFGLPVVEALLCKTPVITSHVSSLPEAGGPGSLYVDPYNPEELAFSIEKILNSSGLRKKMADTGYAYAMKTFAPEVTSRRMMELYHALLSAS